MRANKGGSIGINGERYEGGQFLPTWDHEKGICRKAEREAKAASRKLEMAERNRKADAAMVLYADDPRIRAVGHFRETEACILAQNDGIWESL